ncbi:MAG TPA: transposase [Verrucomicrobiae bacterium]
MKKVEANQAVSAPVEPSKPRRKFDRNFKKEAVALWLNSGRSAREVATELGIGENRLYFWRKKFAPLTPAAEADMESQLQALRRENAELRQQRDILKKTLGILSAPPSNGMNGLML